MNRVKGYLAGPINARTSDEVFAWRKEMKGLVPSIDWLDPADRDFRGIEAGNEKDIVEPDKADILECDVILAYCWAPSAGTSMEILYAWERGVTVISVVPEGQPISPWVTYHSDVVHRSLSAAAADINDRMGSREAVIALSEADLQIEDA